MRYNYDTREGFSQDGMSRFGLDQKLWVVVKTMDSYLIIQY